MDMAAVGGSLHAHDDDGRCPLLTIHQVGNAVLKNLLRFANSSGGIAQRSGIAFKGIREIDAVLVLFLSGAVLVQRDGNSACLHIPRDDVQAEPPEAESLIVHQVLQRSDARGLRHRR